MVYGDLYHASDQRVYGGLYHARDPACPNRGLQALKPCQGPTWTGEARMLVIPKQLNPPFKLKNRYIGLTSPVSGGH